MERTYYVCVTEVAPFMCLCSDSSKMCLCTPWLNVGTWDGGGWSDSLPGRVNPRGKILRCELHETWWAPEPAWMLWRGQQVLTAAGNWTASVTVSTELFRLRTVINTRVGTLIVATIYLQLIQNRYMFRSFTVLHCSHQHCVQPVASDVEVVGYL